MRRQTFLIPLLLVFGMLALGQPVQAQIKSLYWDVWDTTLTILPNGDLHVVERQRIKFTDGTFTFGFREIPLAQTGGISDVSVSEPGITEYREDGSFQEPFTFDVTTIGRDKSIRWNFPPTANTTRTFDLAYTVHDALRVYDSGDKLQWKPIATDRDFPIQEASVRVVLPEGAAFQIIDRDGVQATWAQSADGTSVTFLANEPMSPSDFMEVGIEFTHGFIPDEEPQWQRKFDFEENVKPRIDIGLGLLTALIIIGGPALVFWIWYTRGRDPEVGEVPEYITAPPDDLPPGVLGTLIDEKADIQDVVATIVDLGRKAALRIAETNKNGSLGLGSAEFVFVKEASQPQGLNAVESEMMSGIFKGSHSVELSDLRNNFYKSLPKIQGMLYADVVSRGLFRANPDSTRKLWRQIGFALVSIGIGLGFCLGAAFATITSVTPCLFGGLVLTGIAVLVAAGAMPAKTAKGSESAAKWRAFKIYLQRIDHGDFSTARRFRPHPWSPNEE